MHIKNADHLPIDQLKTLADGEMTTDKYVSDSHKAELKKIHAIKGIQVVMVEAVKDLGDNAGNSSVNKYITKRLGPIYTMFDRPRDAGLDAGITNANYSLCHCKGFIERGGDHDNTHPDLHIGQWRFVPGGYEAARKWIDNYDSIKELINNIVNEYDIKTSSPVDDNAIFKEAQTAPDVKEDIKSELIRLLTETNDKLQQIGRSLDQPLKIGKDKPKRVSYMQRQIG